MKKLTLVIIVFNIVYSGNTQDLSSAFRLGISTTIDKNLSSESMAFGKHTGYSAEYVKLNYRMGLNLEYEILQGFVIYSAINYSNKDFVGIYYCAVCDFSIPPRPQDINFRFVEIPLSLRYYFMPEEFRIFGEIGVNNLFLLNKEEKDESFSLGIKLGAGIEYSFTKEIALQILIDYNKGITNLYNESDFKMRYLGAGIGILKSL